MALTRIGSVGLATGIDINAGVGTFTGNLTVGGVLTYEDVTNVDSIGIITARAGVLVGSGITLSKDGDVFFTGIATGNGSGLTNLTAGNLTGALPAISGANLTGIAATDNVRTGILDVAGVGTFRDDVNIADKIVHLGDTDTAIRFSAADTISIETGGVTRATVSGNNIDFPDAGTLRFGTSNDLQIYHGTGGASNIIHSNTSQPLIINASGAGTLRFDTNSTERLRITSTGDMGLGTSSPMNFFELKNSTAQKRLVLSKSSSGAADENGMWLQFNNYGPSATARAADTIIGKLHFYASQPTSGNLQDAGAIECRADGSQTGNVTKSYLSLLTVDTNTAIERLRITGNGTLQFRNINATASTDNVASVNFIGPYVYQHSKTVTATTNGSGAVTFDLGCPFIYDGTTFEYFLNASPTDNTNFTTTYQKGFFTKARGGGIGQFYVLRNDSAKSGCSLGTPTAGNPNGHQFNVAISGAVANKEYRATILYTGISRYNGY